MHVHLTRLGFLEHTAQVLNPNVMILFSCYAWYLL